MTRRLVDTAVLPKYRPEFDTTTYEVRWIQLDDLKAMKIKATINGYTAEKLWKAIQKDLDVEA
jgi:hypothetical protein